MADILSTVMDVRGLVVKPVSFIYGLVTLGAFVLRGLIDGKLFGKPSEKAVKELAAARKRYWDLNNPPKGLKHNFHTLKDGTKLHYVTAVSSNPPPANLVIFIHGFPDSWVVWKYQLLSSKLARDATLVALDLPGYGGSDDLPMYDATSVLEAVAQFCLAMKTRYIHHGGLSSSESTGTTTIVCHDWATVMGARLASEAPQVADRFVLTGMTLPKLWLANLQGRWNTFLHILRTWRRNPRSITLLKKAFVTLGPVLAQLQKSGYVFAFNLPGVIIGQWARLGGAAWFYGFTAALAYDPNLRKKLDPESKEAAEAMAMSMGPGADESSGIVAELPSATNGQVSGTKHHKDDDDELLAYPAPVRHRVADGGFSTKIRLYRDFNIWAPWEKSMDTLWLLSQEEQSANSFAANHRRSSAAPALFDSRPDGALKTPATVLWGSKDPAGDVRVTLHGMQDYLLRGSQVFLLEKAGHWMSVETRAKVVLEQVVEWAVTGEKENLKDIICGDDSYPIKLMAER